MDELLFAADDLADGLLVQSYGFGDAAVGHALVVQVLDVGPGARDGDVDAAAAAVEDSLLLFGELVGHVGSL
ncbi:hypothetical protein GCM10023259_103360 [Thermocatellispora tengchongensis]|uniref:hypothetical protein n=1 Tax=Thermocatellispora tengchongensis TaxID=1073253 RepID=UPI0031EA7405